MAFAYTNNTVFRPFSYQEMLAPIMQATQAHQEIENAYTELDSQANAVGSLANEADDPITYAKYKAFENSLRNQASLLAQQGLNPNSRKVLNTLKSNYAKDIIPINNAVTRRRMLAEEQRKALLQNPTLMFQRNFNNKSVETSLDRFIDNPEYDYGERYSGAMLAQQVSQAAANLARELTKTSTGRLDAFTKTFIQKHGYSRNQILDAINNPNRVNSQPVLNAIVESTMDASGMKNWADVNTLNQAYNYARQGLWSAIGQTDIKPYADKAAELAAHEAMQRKLKGSKSDIPEEKALNKLPIYSQKKLNDEQKRYNANIKKFSKYFDAVAGKLTREGWDEYHKKYPKANKAIATANVNDPWYGRTQSIKATEDSEFKKLMDEIGFKPSKTGGYGSNQARQAYRKFNNYIEDDPLSKTLTSDATRYYENVYDVPTSSEYQTQYKIKTLAALGNANKINIVDLDEENGKWKNTGKHIDKEDFLDNKKYTIESRRSSELGSVLVLVDNEGNTYRIKDAKGINLTAETNRDIAIENKNILERMLMNPNLPDTERAVLEAEYKNQDQNLYLFESQRDIVNKTEAQKNNPYAF